MFAKKQLVAIGLSVMCLLWASPILSQSTPPTVESPPEENPFQNAAGEPAKTEPQTNPNGEETPPFAQQPETPLRDAPLAPNRVRGMELPAELTVEPNEGFVQIEPKFDEGIRVLQVEWAVASAGEKPVKYDDRDPRRLILSVPAPGEEVLVFANAMLQSGQGTPWMTKHAMTVVTTTPGQGGNGSGGGGPPDENPPDQPVVTPTQPPVNPNPGQPTPIPPEVQGLHVVLVFDITKAPRELGLLTQSATLRRVLAKNGSVFYAYDIRSPVLVKTKIKPLVDELGQLPALIIISNGGKNVLPNGKALPLPLTGDPLQTENLLLDTVGKAAQPTMSYLEGGR
jgi:hypothetical protein